MSCIQEIEGYRFEGWGGHTNQPFSAYMTAAAAMGNILISILGKI